MDGSGGYNPDSFLDFSQYTFTTNASTMSTPFEFMATPNTTPTTFNPSQFFSFQDPSLFTPPTTAPPPTNIPTAIPLAFMGGREQYNVPLTMQPSAFAPIKYQPPSPPTPSPPQSSNPSSPQGHTASTPSPPPSQNAASFKRKRTSKEELMKVNTGIAWEDYLPPDTPVLRLMDKMSPVGPFSLQVGHIDKNAIVEPLKCIIYRQNQFKLQCTLSGSLRTYTTPTSDIMGNTVLYGSIDDKILEVDGLFLKLYAFKQAGDETTEEFKVPIHQVGPSRTKKETKPPEIMPIFNGGAFFDKLQFQASTHAGSEAFFRVVITVVAKVQEKFYVTGAKISPKLLVRAQNPGRYNAQKASGGTSAHSSATTNPHHHNSPGSDGSAGEGGNEEYEEMYGSMYADPPPPLPLPLPLPIPFATPANLVENALALQSSGMDEAKTGWVNGDGDVVYYYGRVGINTSTPKEALHVNGNIMFTGNLLKPSDRRLKKNFVLVDSGNQLDVINKINIYDYDVEAGNSHKRERGVIAQEVQEILPAAVQPVGQYTTQSGQKLDNLLVVNERVLLMENIGATQYLDKRVQEEREELNYVNSKVEEMEQEERKKSSYVMKMIHSIGSLLMSEDFRESPADEWIYCGFSVCGLGPAWSVFVSGFFFQPMWFLGSLYVSSNNSVKRAAGIANLLMLIVAGLMLTGLVFIPHRTPIRVLLAAVVILGVIFLVIISCYSRSRARIRSKVLKNSLNRNLRRMRSNSNRDREGSMRERERGESGRRLDEERVEIKTQR